MSDANSGVTNTSEFQNTIKVFSKNGNVIFPKFFSLGLGATGDAHSTRAETIGFTYSNKKLLEEYELRPYGCDFGMNGIQIQSDLKIDDFIWNKATLVRYGVVTTTPGGKNPFNVFQETLTFVVSLGGSITPTWKFTTVVLNPNSPSLSAMRSETNTLIITIGPLQRGAQPLALEAGALNQHQAASAGVATAGSQKASQ